jgi:hypothetical protein
VKVRSFAEFTLSRIRFFAPLRMTADEGLRMTADEGLRMTKQKGLTMRVFSTVILRSVATKNL